MNYSVLLSPEKMKIVLHVVEGFNGVPSVDPFSAHLIYLLKINDVTRIEVNVCKYTTSANLPRLEFDNEVITRPDELRKFIDVAIHYRHIERNPPPPVNGKCVYKNFIPMYSYQNVDTKIIEKVATLNGWSSNENKMFTTKLYSKGIYYPLRFLFAKSLKSKMDSDVHKLHYFQWHPDLDKINEKAASCLRKYSNVLGNKPFMLGDYPTNLDVYMCSYLAPALLYNFPDNKLEKIIKRSGRNLKNYTKHFVELFGDNSTAFPKAKPSSDRFYIPVMVAAGVLTVSALIFFSKYYRVFQN